MVASIIRFLNIVLVALLAGTSFGIWVGFNPKNYSYTTYVEQQQHLVLSLNSLMVSMVIVSTLITIISAFIQRKNKTVFVLLLLAAAFLGSCIFISRFGNLPIQQEILTWKADSYPEHWTLLRDEWWDFHIMRTIVELLALVLVAWVSSFATFHQMKPKTS